MDLESFSPKVARGRWQLSAPARRMVTWAVLLVLLVIFLDGAATWHVTNRAAGTVADIADRDGNVAVDDSDLGVMHTLEIERASGSDATRIRLGGAKWIPAAAIAIAAGFFTPRADPRLRAALVIAVALALAVSVAPRLLYYRELPVLDAVFG